MDWDKDIHNAFGDPLTLLSSATMKLAVEWNVSTTIASITMNIVFDFSSAVEKLFFE